MPNVVNPNAGMSLNQYQAIYNQYVSENDSIVSSEAYEKALKMLKQPKKVRKDTVSMLVKDHIQKNRVIIYPYKKVSKSGKALASNFHVKMTDYVIYGDLPFDDNPYLLVNWGSRGVPVEYTRSNIKILNPADKIAIASNKLDFLNCMNISNVRTPEFTTEPDVALAWGEEGHEVLGRRKYGSCGKDIVFFSEDIVGFMQSEFWTKYKKKKAEYRIHIFDGKIIDQQRKALRKTDEQGNEIDPSDIDFRVRNLANGFVFVRNDVNPPDDVVEQALRSIEATGLDFGAVDVMWNATEMKAYVLEINTAPGLEGSTIESYVNAINAVKEQM